MLAPVLTAMRHPLFIAGGLIGAGIGSCASWLAMSRAQRTQEKERRAAFVEGLMARRRWISQGEMSDELKAKLETMFATKREKMRAAAAAADADAGQNDELGLDEIGKLFEAIRNGEAGETIIFTFGFPPSGQKPKAADDDIEQPDRDTNPWAN